MATTPADEFKMRDLLAAHMSGLAGVHWETCPGDARRAWLAQADVAVAIVRGASQAEAAGTGRRIAAPER